MLARNMMQTEAAKGTAMEKSMAPEHYQYDGASEAERAGKQQCPYRILTMAIAFSICWIHLGLAAGLLLFYRDTDIPISTRNYCWIAYHMIGSFGALCGFLGACTVSLVVFWSRLSEHGY